jgi:hypothetical protein
MMQELGPIVPIPQPAHSEAVIPTEAADGCIVRRASGVPGELARWGGAVEGPPHLNSAPTPTGPLPLTPDPSPITLPALQACIASRYAKPSGLALTDQWKVGASAPGVCPASNHSQPRSLFPVIP